jgi:hypothetical protein
VDGGIVEGGIGFVGAGVEGGGLEAGEEVEVHFWFWFWRILKLFGGRHDLAPAFCWSFTIVVLPPMISCSQFHALSSQIPTIDLSRSQVKGRNKFMMCSVLEYIVKMSKLYANMQGCE